MGIRDSLCSLCLCAGKNWKINNRCHLRRNVVGYYALPLQGTHENRKTPTKCVDTPRHRHPLSACLSGTFPLEWGEVILIIKLAMKILTSLFVPRLFAPGCLISCSLMLPATLSAQESGNPAPGKQVAQNVELPASTSIWNFGADGIRLIGEPRPLDESKTDTVHYWLFLPADYEAQAQFGGAPLLLFLHGAGERGNASGEEIAKVKVHGPPRLLDNPEFAKSFPCITISPQCKDGFAWSPAQLMLLLDHIEKNYKIDKSRVYVTGLSMGGFGTWMCLNEAPHRFAAAAPICGGAKPEWAEKMVDIPLWVFHGDRDTVVVPALSERIVDAIRKAGGRKILLTMYEGVGHDSWTPTYNNQMLYDWMFQQSLERAGNAGTQVPMVEKQIGKGPIIGGTLQDGRDERWNATIHVAIRKTDEANFDRRYAPIENEIIDRVTTVLAATAGMERREVGHTTIKEKLRRTINEVLGTPWVQEVYLSDVSVDLSNAARNASGNPGRGQVNLNRVRVEGIVTSRGVPIEDAVVTFHSPEGPVAAGKTDGSGKYTLQPVANGTNIPSGEYRVTFTKNEDGVSLLPQVYSRVETSPFVAFIRIEITSRLYVFDFALD